MIMIAQYMCEKHYGNMKRARSKERALAAYDGYY